MNYGHNLFFFLTFAGLKLFYGIKKTVGWIKPFGLLCISNSRNR